MEKAGGISKRAISKYIHDLKEHGRLKRVSTAKGGNREVIERSNTDRGI
jgi:hypothetical protein